MYSVMKIENGHQNIKKILCYQNSLIFGKKCQIYWLEKCLPIFPDFQKLWVPCTWVQLITNSVTTSQHIGSRLQKAWFLQAITLAPAYNMFGYNEFGYNEFSYYKFGYTSSVTTSSVTTSSVKSSVTRVQLLWVRLHKFSYYKFGYTSSVTTSSATTSSVATSSVTMNSVTTNCIHIKGLFTLTAAKAMETQIFFLSRMGYIGPHGSVYMENCSKGNGNPWGLIQSILSLLWMSLQGGHFISIFSWYFSHYFSVKIYGNSTTEVYTFLNANSGVFPK